MNRWALYLDIEGFSAIHRQHDGRALWLLTRLVRGVYDVAAQHPNLESERLFVHQVGDGFVIISDFQEPTLDRPIAIAISLMRYLLMWGGVCRAGISEGDFADITGCYDPELREVRDGGHYLRLPSGIMTIFPVMGGALVNAVETQDNNISGPMLFVDPAFRERLTDDALVFLEDSAETVAIDWLRSDPRNLSALLGIPGSCRADALTLAEQLRSYVKASPGLSAPWRANANALIEGPPYRHPLVRKHSRKKAFWACTSSALAGFTGGLVLSKILSKMSR